MTTLAGLGVANGLFGSSVGALLGQPSTIPNQTSLGLVLPIVLGPTRRLFPNLDFGMVTRPVPVYYGGGRCCSARFLNYVAPKYD